MTKKIEHGMRMSRLGQINKLEIQQESCVAYVTFADLLDAFCAKMYLNNIGLSRDNAKLSVEFKIQKCESKPETKSDEST